MEKYLTHTTDLIGSGLSTINNEFVQGLSFGYNQAQLLVVHVWAVLVQQQLILGFQELITGVLLTAVAVVASFFFRKTYKIPTLDPWDKALLLLVIGITGISFLTSGLEAVIASLPHLLNPQYYALQESLQILNQIKQ